MADTSAAIARASVRSSTCAARASSSRRRAARAEWRSIAHGQRPLPQEPPHRRPVHMLMLTSGRHRPRPVSVECGHLARRDPHQRGTQLLRSRLGLRDQGAVPVGYCLAPCRAHRSRDDPRLGTPREQPDDLRLDTVQLLAELFEVAFQLVDRRRAAVRSLLMIPKSRSFFSATSSKRRARAASSPWAIGPSGTRGTPARSRKRQTSGDPRYRAHRALAPPLRHAGSSSGRLRRAAPGRATGPLDMASRGPVRW